MPYNPTQRDISGQLRGQGIADLGQGIAEGFRSYQQNKMMSAQAVATFEATAQANPDIIKFLSTPDAPTEAAKAFQKLQKDGSLSVRDASLLAQFSNTYSSQKQAQSQQALQAQQAENQRQEAVYRASQAAAQKRKEEDSARAEAALRTAAQSPMAQAIQEGTPFDQLGQYPKYRPVADVYQRYAQSGAPISPEVVQFLHAGLAAEDQRSQIAERAKASEERTAARTGAPTFTTDPNTGLTVSTLNGSQLLVKTPKDTSMEERLTIAKKIQQAAKDGDFETAAALGMALGHKDMMGNPVGPDAYRVFSGQPQPPPQQPPKKAPDGLFILTPEQAKAAAPGRFHGDNGKNYEKLKDGSIRQL